MDKDEQESFVNDLKKVLVNVDIINYQLADNNFLYIQMTTTLDNNILRLSINCSKLYVNDIKLASFVSYDGYRYDINIFALHRAIKLMKDIEGNVKKVHKFHFGV